MTKWKTILCCGALLSGLSGCEDTRSDYMEEFQTLVYFRNSGEQTLSLYLTGENTLYDIPICKSGRDLDATATAWIVVMDQAQLDIYNIENLTDYVQLPASCYKFLTPTEFAFTGKDAYQVARVELDTNAVSDLQAQDPSAHYVLALQVYSDRPIGASVNLLMLSLQIDIPQLSLASSGLVKANYTASSPVVNTYQNSVALNIDNSWDFTCPLEVLGQEWLDAYNSENETEYKLLPAGSFTVPTEVTFKAGEKSVPFEISVDRSGLELLEEYLLPVRLAGCSKEEFAIEASSSEYLLNVRLDPDKITLSADMASSPYTHTGDGGGLPALFDGEVSAASYWHSFYGGGPVGDPQWGYYIDLALKEQLSTFYLRYATRSNPNAVPADVRIGVSEDGKNWTEVGRVSSGLPTEGLVWASLPVYSLPTAFKHIRLGVLSSAGSAGSDLTVPEGTGACVAFSELELYGADLTK